MTTYNTYQEAKIANPDCEIHKHCVNDEFATREESSKRPRDFLLAACNPAEHCMTVEKFLADGHKLVNGDALLDVFGGLIVVGSDYSVLGANIKLDTDDRRYILRAAALEEEEPELTKDDSPQGILSAISNRLHNIGCEHQDSELGEELGSMACDIWGVLPLISNESIQEKKPRAKVECVKCEFSHAWEAVKAFEDGEKLYTKRSHKDYILIDNAPDVLRFLYDLHERIETPMTEREAFVEALQELWIIDGVDGKEQMDKIVDSGLFKLVN